MTFTTFQQKILKDIFSYKPEGTHCIVKDLLDFLFNKNFHNLGILLSKDRPFEIYKNKLKDNDYLDIKNKIQELFFLFQFLEDERLLVYIEVKTNYPLNSNSFSFSHGNFNKKESEKIYLDSSITNKIIENLYSDFYISSLLKDLVKNKFKTKEDKNLKITLWALIFSVIFAFFQMCLSLYIAKNIPVSIEFQDPQKIAIIKNNDIFSKRSNYNGFFNKN